MAALAGAHVFRPFRARVWAQMCRCVGAVFSASKNGAYVGLCSDAVRSAAAEQERVRRQEFRRAVHRHLEGALGRIN